jgi:uncharacterized membrane protein
MRQLIDEIRSLSLPVIAGVFALVAVGYIAAFDVGGAHTRAADIEQINEANRRIELLNQLLAAATERERMQANSADVTRRQAAQLLQQSASEAEALSNRITALESMVAPPSVEVIELADAGTADEATEIRIPVSEICGDDARLAETQRADCEMARNANSPYLYYYLDNSDAHPPEDVKKLLEEATKDASS